jgi:hypothetical protein
LASPVGTFICGKKPISMGHMAKVNGIMRMKENGHDAVVNKKQEE